MRSQGVAVLIGIALAMVGCSARERAVERPIADTERATEPAAVDAGTDAREPIEATVIDEPRAPVAATVIDVSDAPRSPIEATIIHADARGHDDAIEPAVGAGTTPGAAILDAGAALGPGNEAGAIERVPARWQFFGQADGPVREALATEPIAEVDHGGGGRSLGFKVTLADGTRGYFKPDQSFNGMRWYAEIAAYHLDRELGLGRVAPVVGRTFAWSELREAAGDDSRVGEIRVGEDGVVQGAFIQWVPSRPTPLALPTGWETWLRIDGTPDRVSPFQRPGEYRRALARADESEPSEPAMVPEPDRPERPAELSDLIVFDYLTNDLDRWGTNNTNVRTVGPGGPLMFLDNAASFTLRRARIEQMDARLHAVERFRRSTIDAVRRFDVERFAARLAADPLAPSLEERQLENLEERRAHLLAYVDALVEQHGEEAVYAF